jgi:DNA-binding Xre family transcriptional regulator
MDFKKNHKNYQLKKKIKLLNIERIILNDWKKVYIMKKLNNENLTTFDRFMQDPKRKEKFDKDYGKFLLKEFLLEAMDENHMSVRKLAEESGISTSIIQNIRTKKTSNITFNTLNTLISTLGYRLVIEKVDKTESKIKKHLTKNVAI